jgi:glycosyltransferase involved in cell wall biosynthesis
LQTVFDLCREFDLIHFHIDYLHFPLSRREKVNHVTTLHGRLDIPDLVPLYRTFPEMPVISISDSQRRPLPWLNWIGNVHHGVPVEQFHLQETPGNYLAFLGRISIEKRLDRAISIARRCGMPLKVAAKISDTDRDYFERKIKTLLDPSIVEYVGEINESEKDEFLGNAHALLFPIDWPEPFGLVMIEAMACGTPVIAYRAGSVQEVIDCGVTGFIVENEQEAADAVPHVSSLSRRKCREVFERRFSATRMARDYLRIYEQMLAHPFGSERSLAWKN